MKKIVALLLAVLMAASMLSVAGAEEKKVYNVVNLVNGNLGDKSFYDSAESGLKRLADAGRITYKTIEMGGDDSDQPTWLSAARISCRNTSKRSPSSIRIRNT